MNKTSFWSVIIWGTIFALCAIIVLAIYISAKNQYDSNHSGGNITASVSPAQKQADGDIGIELPDFTCAGTLSEPDFGFPLNEIDHFCAHLFAGVAEMLGSHGTVSIVIRDESCVLGTIYCSEEADWRVEELKENLNPPEQPKSERTVKKQRRNLGKRKATAPKEELLIEESLFDNNEVPANTRP